MKVGWGFTAVAQRVPRLAGLAWFPADWPIQVAVGRQALRLALKANVIWKTYMPFSLQQQPGNEATSQPALFDLRPTQAAAQSGDRQRREKALPFLKEEKSEHERAPRAGGSCLTLLRATLRTPSFKNGQSRAFSRRVSAANRGRGQPEGLPQTEARDAQRGGPPLESPCRWLFLVLSFASKESTTPFGAEAPPSAPESARQAPGGNFLRQNCPSMSQAGGFPRGKQSARPALPCAPLVVCLNSGSFPPSADSPLG